MHEHLHQTSPRQPYSHVVLQNLVNSTKQQLVTNRELIERLEHTTAAEPHTETAVYNAFKSAAEEWVG